MYEVLPNILVLPLEALAADFTYIVWKWVVYERKTPE